MFGLSIHIFVQNVQKYVSRVVSEDSYYSINIPFKKSILLIIRFPADCPYTIYFIVEGFSSI